MTEFSVVRCVVVSTGWQEDNDGFGSTTNCASTVCIGVSDDGQNLCLECAAVFTYPFLLARSCASGRSLGGFAPNVCLFVYPELAKLEAVGKLCGRELEELEGFFAINGEYELFLVLGL